MRGGRGCEAKQLINDFISKPSPPFIAAEQFMPVDRIKVFQSIQGMKNVGLKI